MGAAPNPFSVMRSSWRAQRRARWQARPAALRAMQRLPNISVVVSLRPQRVPRGGARELGGSEVSAGGDSSSLTTGRRTRGEAQRILAKTLAAARRAAGAAAAKLVGLDGSDLGRFKDEVLKTPTVASRTREHGYSRSARELDLLFDGDDMVSDTYFLKAMAVVVVEPSDEPRLRNSAIPGESKWQWHRRS